MPAAGVGVPAPPGGPHMVVVAQQPIGLAAQQMQPPNGQQPFNGANMDHRDAFNNMSLGGQSGSNTSGLEENKKFKVSVSFDR